MCTVLLRFAPGASWPVVLAAVRDEFADRPWDPPAAHWAGRQAHLLGGRDRTAGGTWLAVDPTPGRPAVAALLNGVRRPPAGDGARPTRGTLALDVLSTGRVPSLSELPGYDGFHLLLATPDRAEVWSWDGEVLDHQLLTAGDHILVNLGVDAPDDPLVPHFAPLLGALPRPPLTHRATLDAWREWAELLEGGGLDATDPRALIVRREIEDRVYASTSASLVAASAERLRYDFNPLPPDPAGWYQVPTADGDR